MRGLLVACEEVVAERPTRTAIGDKRDRRQCNMNQAYDQVREYLIQELEIASFLPSVSLTEIGGTPKYAKQSAQDALRVQ